ncbi:hypothetical protein [Arthrobacter sp. Br18]|nr:hypothetical protein [Arthrobacter sp. Br18]
MLVQPKTPVENPERISRHARWMGKRRDLAGRVASAQAEGSHVDY